MIFDLNFNMSYRFGVDSLVVVLLALPSSLAISHGGGLDAYGCHHDRRSGGYHCHRGSGHASSRGFIAEYPPVERMYSESQVLEFVREAKKVAENKFINLATPVIEELKMEVAREQNKNKSLELILKERDAEIFNLTTRMNRIRPVECRQFHE